MGAVVGHLGRLVPTDDRHLEKYPLRTLMPTAVAEVERVLQLPDYRSFYNQGTEGACVGFAFSWCMSILNVTQRRRKDWEKYDANWLWNRAKATDEYDFTNPGDNNGTSLRAGAEVLRLEGHRQVERKRVLEVDPENGITAYRWAWTVDEMRTAIAAGIPVVFGWDWFSEFDSPQRYGNDYWIARRPDWNSSGIRGGHAICCNGASDKRQAFKLVNSWGTAYPLVWISYNAVEFLMGRWGESCVVTDR